MAQAGADAFIDLKGRLRDPNASTIPHVFSADQIQAGLTGESTADVILRAAVRETSTGQTGLVKVTTLIDPPFISVFYANRFRPDTGTAPPQDVGFYGTNPAPIAATYSFGSASAAGLIAAGSGNIVVIAADSDPTATPVNVTGFTDIVAGGTGHIDVTTSGFVTLTERAGDLRVGRIASTAADVTLTAPGAILSAGADGTGRVIGDDITLSADSVGGSGGIGTANNLLETDLLDGGRTGVLTAGATGSVFVREVEGDLRLNAVFSAAQDIALETLSGSILNRLASPFVPANVLATSIDLVANGGGIGEASRDLLIDSSRAGSGRLGERRCAAHRPGSGDSGAGPAPAG